MKVFKGWDLFSKISLQALHGTIWQSKSSSVKNWMGIWGLKVTQ